MIRQCVPESYFVIISSGAINWGNLHKRDDCYAAAPHPHGVCRKKERKGKVGRDLNKCDLLRNPFLLCSHRAATSLSDIWGFRSKSSLNVFFLVIWGFHPLFCFVLWPDSKIGWLGFVKIWWFHSSSALPGQGRVNKKTTANSQTLTTRFRTLFMALWQTLLPRGKLIGLKRI